MPIVSKYNNEQFDALMNDLITALEKHKAPVDLSLMVLGNLTTNIINGMARPSVRRSPKNTSRRSPPRWIIATMLTESLRIL